MTDIMRMYRLPNTWAGASWMTSTFLRLMPAKAGEVEMTIKRLGEDSTRDIIAKLPMLPEVEALNENYPCEKIDVLFVELGPSRRILLDLPETFGGVIAAGSVSGTYNLPIMRGFSLCLIRDVNGKTFNTFSEFKTLLDSETSSASQIRFLTLDLKNMDYRYVTVEVKR